MNMGTIKRICAAHDVRVSVGAEQGRRVIGLHGFKANIEAAVRKITGYWIKWGTTGAYLFNERTAWK